MSGNQCKCRSFIRGGKEGDGRIHRQHPKHHKYDDGHKQNPVTTLFSGIDVFRAGAQNTG